jgi:hypothetical protein
MVRRVLILFALVLSLPAAAVIGGGGPASASQAHVSVHPHAKPPPHVPGLPPGYSFCVREGQTCQVSGIADVAFGAGGKFHFKDGVSGSIACTDAMFGDPDLGVAKSCYTAPDPNPGPGYSFCTKEGQTCRVSGLARVAFGADGKFYFKDGVSGSIACTDAVFGDPDFGVVKSCYAAPDSGPAGYSFCTPEGQTCYVSGVADVAFGAGGKFYFKDGVSGSIACTDAVFGDPDYGVVKSCYTIPA